MSRWQEAFEEFSVGGTVIRLQVECLPSDATPKPVWLRWSGTDATTADINRLWQAFLRRFDIEHTFRLFKQTPGWTCPKIRTLEAADRWTWPIVSVFTQLRLARPLAADLRRPWEKPVPPDRLTPARVRRDFRRLRPKAARPARAPKSSRPGPVRPPGRRNNQPTARYDVHTVRKPGPTKRHEEDNDSTSPPHRLKIKLVLGGRPRPISDDEREFFVTTARTRPAELAPLRALERAQARRPPGRQPNPDGERRPGTAAADPASTGSPSGGPAPGRSPKLPTRTPNSTASST